MNDKGRFSMGLFEFFYLGVSWYMFLGMNGVFFVEFVLLFCVVSSNSN